MQRGAFVAAGMVAALSVLAQDPPGLAAAKSVDKQIEKVNDLPEAQRIEAIWRAEDTGPDLLQQVADTLADALRDVPASDQGHGCSDSRYDAELSRLDDKDRQRGQANFLLTDLRGHSWSLKELRGKVVLVTSGAHGADLVSGSRPIWRRFTAGSNRRASF